jgi:hypothetical protein
MEKGECSSIKQLIEVTDKLANKLGIKVDISYMTKFYVIKDLLKQKLLTEGKKDHSLPIFLSDEIKKQIVTALSGIVDVQ